MKKIKIKNVVTSKRIIVLTPKLFQKIKYSFTKLFTKYSFKIKFK